MDPLLEQYLQEARENLKFVEQNIEDIGNGDMELINSIFRAVHTIKGGSGIVEFNAIRDISHNAEDLLDMLRSEKIEFHSEMTDGLYNAFDEILNLIEAAEETGGVVEANDEILEGIISNLKELMGKKDEVIIWQIPFRACKKSSSIIHHDFTLGQIDGTIPFKLDKLNEENFQDKRLYAVLFDVDENCMIFGNDPIYAMSLVGDKLVSIYSCFSNTTAKNLIDGQYGEDDDLLLRTKIIGFIYATFSELEDGIYNFIDDSYILPLDINLLLDIDMEGIEEIDLIKDLVLSIQKSIDEQNIDNIKSAISEALGLINKNTKLAFILRRIFEILKVINSDDLSKLTPVIETLSANNTTSVRTKEESKIVEENSSTVEVKTVEYNVDEKNLIISMLEQQYEQLLNSDDIMLFNRVDITTKKCANALGIEYHNITAKEQLLSWLKENINIEEESIEPKKVEEKKIKIEDTTKDSVVEVVLEEPKVEEKKEEIKQEEPIVKQKAKPVQKREEKKDVIGKVVKIDQESIDDLMSIVGELLVAKNSLPYLAESVVDMEPEHIKRSILEKYLFINRLSNQLQDLIISMRMLPISYVFDRYPKLIRDISKKLNKKVKLVQDGGDTKLDKNIIEMLADPLIHIVRNSLDHGLELEDERLESGKDKAGLLTMKAYPESDKVIVEIIDDGKGIAVDKVANKCVEKGLLTQEQVDKMSFKEKTQLVMLPGLSTAEAITEFSGRGVGMDVVKKSIEGFGGNIDITTEDGKGTRIILSIPMSLAVSTLLQVSMDGNNYGFPMDLVSETVKIESKEITYLNNEPYIYIREQVIPLLFVDGMLAEDTIQNTIISIVIITIKGNQLAIVVNELLGQIDVVQKPLEGILENHALFSGAALLGNGRIIMILDSLGLLDMQMNGKG